MVVTTGLVYRSSQLSGIAPADMEKLAQLRFRSVYDLRTADERAKHPEELPPGSSYFWLDVLADSPGAGPAQLDKLLHDPKAANAALGHGKIEAMFEQGYREFISLPSARREFRTLFLALGDSGKLPAVFHCTTGKDRTGWAAAALLTLLGVSPETVYADYLRSNDYILPAYQKAIDAFAAAGGDPAIPTAVFGVRKAYLDASFDEMRKLHGTIESYFADGLGIDAAGQQALRDMFLSPAATPQ
jgi:protein-tyrosine phosphatase